MRLKIARQRIENLNIIESSRKYNVYIIRRSSAYNVNTRCTACILAPTFPDTLQSGRRNEMTARRIILCAWKKRSNDCISEVELRLDPFRGCPITSQLTPRKKINGRVIAQSAYVNPLSSLRMYGSPGIAMVA